MGLRESPEVERVIVAATSLSHQYAGPGFRDWMLLGISVMFVLCGLIGLLLNPSKPNVGIVTITFFGLCTWGFAAVIIRKLRLRRPRPLQVEIVGGVPIRPRIYYLVIGALTGLGAVIIVFGREYPSLFWYIGWLLAIAGCAILFGLAIGRSPIGYLQFDPSGITVSRGAWTYTIPWEGISSISVSELTDLAAVLLISLHHDDVVSVHPAKRKRSLTRHFARNRRRVGVPVWIVPERYGMDPLLLFQALERYRTSPSARAELSRRLLSSQDG
jgi:hypothetical protein